jgi:hypothetical protein
MNLKDRRGLPDRRRRILQVPGVCKFLSAGRKFQTSAPTAWPDQIETGTAYHGIPESHMKAALQMPKWHAPKYLGLAVFFTTKKWRKSCLRKYEFVLKAGRRKLS